MLKKDKKCETMLSNAKLYFEIPKKGLSFSRKRIKKASAEYTLQPRSLIS